MHAVSHRQSQTKRRVSCSGNDELERTVKAETKKTEHRARAPIPYPSPSTLSAHIQGMPLGFASSLRHIDPSTNIPNLVRLPDVLGPPLHPQLSPADQAQTLPASHVCQPVCSAHSTCHKNPCDFRGGDGLMESRWTIPGSAQRPKVGNDNCVQGDSHLGGQWMLK